MNARFGRVLLGASLVLLGAGCEGRPRATPAPALEGERQPRTGPALAIFDLGAGAPEQDPQGFLVGARKASFYDLLTELDLAAHAKEVTGIFVRFGPSLGLGRGEELGQALSLVKADKPVYCHADGYGNGTLWVAARGCSRILLSPAGDVDAVGIAAQIIYLRSLLADNLHLTIDFLQIGKYKGAEEPFTRDGPSDEARASLEGTLSDIRDSWLTGIRGARPDVPAQAPEDGPYAPARAKDLHLIDDVAYLDEAKEQAKIASGAVREEVRFGPGALSGREGDLADVVSALAGENEQAPVALIRATGAISMSGGGNGLFGTSSGISEHDLAPLLMRVLHDDRVKAVVLRIDSPGGSALASDLLWHDLMRVREKKPLVVSVGDMAASGGYYLASAGSTIYAEPESIVGSIGVVGGKIAADKALAMIGVHSEVFPAKKGDAKAASRAAYESLFMAWDDDTRARVKDSMVAIYDLFLDRIVEGRGATKLPRPRLLESAEGRIFSGREGKTRGLVDELGGLEDALDEARRLGGLPPDAQVMVLSHHTGLLETLLGMGGAEGLDEKSESKLASAVHGPSAVDLASEAFPDVAPFACGFLPLVKGERTLATVPFALVVK